MKRIYFALTIIFISILFLNCQKELSADNFDPGYVENNLPAPIIATLQGNIYDENGQPAIGVQVTAGTQTSITNDHGYFRIRDAALDKNAALVIAKKAGYFTGYRTFSATSGVNQVVIKLLKKMLAGSVDGASGGDITLNNGSKISLPANGIIKNSDRSSYNGTVNVYAHYIDPAASDIDENVPGSFMANDKNNKRVILKSFGMMAVELESDAGEKLQIESNKTATLTIEIPGPLQSSAPASISLWYIDEQSGLWKEEGTARKYGTTYVGDVKHFSYWNADFSNPAFLVSLKLVNSKGVPLVYANVSIRSSTLGAGHGCTDSLGQVSGIFPANDELTLEVLSECGQIAYSQKIGPFTKNTNLGNITIRNVTSSIVTIEGKIIDCNNAPVSKGYAIINLDNIIRYAAVNNSGDFSTAFVTCSATLVTCEILGVDEMTQQQGIFTTIPITSPVTFAGNIAGCGASSLDFINYNIDGSNYNLSSSSGDSLLAFTNSAFAPLFITTISGSRQNNFIDFAFNNNQTPGIFSLNHFSSDLFINTALIRPVTVNITNYPVNIGDFYEGNFTGNFTDTFKTAPVHKITCSFRVRKYN